MSILCLYSARNNWPRCESIAQAHSRETSTTLVYRNTDSKEITMILKLSSRCGSARVRNI